MAIPKNVTFVSFDVYGTLIDWETGAYEAFAKEAARDGVEIDRDDIVDRFLSVQREIMAGSYELYAEVLRRTAVRIAKDINPTLQKFAKRAEVGLISNIDDKLLGQTRRHLPTDFDLVVTAQQVRSYKPDPAHFNECERRMGTKKGWVHVAESYYYDVEPCLKKKIPVVWVNRRKETLESGQKKPDAEVANLREAYKLLFEG
jgi:2-haloacid dehalogenase